MTAQTAITAALRLIGALGTGESLGASEGTDGREALNAMMDAWKVHKLTILSTTRSTYTLTVATQTYTVGPSVVSPNFTQVRPDYLSGVGILLASSSTIETPLEEMTEWQWRAEAQKTLSGTPTHYRYVKTAGSASITFWPVPDAADTVALYWMTPLTTFADLTTDYSLAPGYEEAIKYNLSVRLCPEFGRPLDATIAALAAESLATIKRANVQDYLLTVDDALLTTGQNFDIETGE